MSARWERLVYIYGFCRAAVTLCLSKCIRVSALWHWWQHNRTFQVRAASIPADLYIIQAFLFFSKGAGRKQFKLTLWIPECVWLTVTRLFISLTDAPRRLCYHTGEGAKQREHRAGKEYRKSSENSVLRGKKRAALFTDPQSGTQKHRNVAGE